jgi:hypothetical protein
MKIWSFTPCEAKLDLIWIIARRVQIKEQNLYFLLTLLFSTYLSTYMQNILDVTLAWSLAVTSHHGQRRLSNAITSMTRQWHHAMANVISTAPSPAWLGSDIAPRPMLPRQCHGQHDSTVTSHNGRRHLSNPIASSTWQWHHTTANIALVAPSPAWLSNTPWPSCLGSATLAWLDSNFTPLPALAQQHHHQHDSGLGAYFPD